MADGSGPGYHSWNAYCGQALSADAVRSGRPATVAAFERRLLELHRLAGELERISCQTRFVHHRAGLDPVLNHLLADTVELLDAVRGSLPAAGTPPPSAPSTCPPSTCPPSTCPPSASGPRADRADAAATFRADGAATVRTECRAEPAGRGRTHGTLVSS